MGPSAHGTVADSHAVIVMCQRLPKRGQTLWKWDTEMQKDGGQGPRGRGQGLGGTRTRDGQRQRLGTQSRLRFTEWPEGRGLQAWRVQTPESSQQPHMVLTAPPPI